MTLAIIGGKWKPAILWELHQGKRHFADLHRVMPRITHKMLTQQLRQLERDGIISRTVVDGSPPGVRYALTEFGNTLRSVLDGLADWGKANHARYGAMIDTVTQT